MIQKQKLHDVVSKMELKQEDAVALVTYISEYLEDWKDKVEKNLQEKFEAPLRKVAAEKAKPTRADIEREHHHTQMLRLERLQAIANLFVKVNDTTPGWKVLVNTFKKAEEDFAKK